jgi:hypothetical protein
MTIIPQKRCTRCNEEFPATPEHFTRDRGRLASHCKTCRKIDRKEDRAKNGDKIREQRRVSDAKRRPKIKIYYAQWCDENKEAIREQKHEYYLEHRDEILERVKLRYQEKKAAIKAYIKQWQADNPDKVREYGIKGYLKVTSEQRRIRNHTRRAKVRAVGGTFNKHDVELQYRSQRGKCWHCGVKIVGKYHLDHLYPIHLGGSNSARNIVISCPFCNYSKGHKPTWEWNGRLL